MAYILILLLMTFWQSNADFFLNNAFNFNTGKAPTLQDAMCALGQLLPCSSYGGYYYYDRSGTGELGDFVDYNAELEEHLYLEKADDRIASNGIENIKIDPVELKKFATEWFRKSGFNNTKGNKGNRRNNKSKNGILASLRRNEKQKQGKQNGRINVANVKKHNQGNLVNQKNNGPLNEKSVRVGTNLKERKRNSNKKKDTKFQRNGVNQKNNLPNSKKNQVARNKAKKGANPFAGLIGTILGLVSSANPIALLTTGMGLLSSMTCLQYMAIMLQCSSYGYYYYYDTTTAAQKQTEVVTPPAHPHTTTVNATTNPNCISIPAKKVTKEVLPAQERQYDYETSVYPSATEEEATTTTIVICTTPVPKRNAKRAKARATTSPPKNKKQQPSNNKNSKIRSERRKSSQQAVALNSQKQIQNKNNIRNKKH